MANSTLVTCLLLASFCACAKLPPTFKKCNRNDSDFNQCLAKAVEGAIRQLNHPIKEVGLPNFEPLEIPSMTIGAGTGAVSFTQNYKNMRVFGFSKITCSKFEMSFEKKTALMECFEPEVKMEFDYEINGKILLLPIYGQGPGTIILSKLMQSLKFTFEEYEKKGHKYFKVIDAKLNLVPQLITFDLKNLFNGDKVLGDNILKVLNENWKEVFGDVKTSYEEAYGQIFTAIFNNLLGKVPISEIFD